MTTTTDANDIGQRRARAGGERGANGEWYEGGKFIATKDNPKSAPRIYEISPEEAARRAALAAEREAQASKLNAWLAARRIQFAVELSMLLDWKPGFAMPAERWADMVETGHAGFAADLARQLRDSGSLSPRQASYFVKFVLGRRNKKNAVQWDALETAVMEEMP